MNIARLCLSFVLALLISFSPAYGAAAPDPAKIFPEVPGLEKKGKPDIYTPDNLYEYINGAADTFLSYNFVRLVGLSYEDKGDRNLTIDIYEHANLNNGFGIYSQERPQVGDFLDIGTQGYYEKGVLNFFKDRYYVKMSSYGLGDKDKETMVAAARKIADRLDGKTAYPLVLTCLPGKDKIQNSEKFIAENFLGHSFLHSAFQAEYRDKDGRSKIFIIEAKDHTEAKKIIAAYKNFATGKGSEISLHGNFYRFGDPYYRSAGKMNIGQKGKYVWGLFGDDMAKVRIFMDHVSDRLTKLHSSL